MENKAVKFRKAKFAKNRNIFQEGEKGNDFYLIEKGSVDVIKTIHNEEILLARLGKGEIFGEMAVLGNKVRTATIRAAEDTELFVLNEEALDIEKSKASTWFIKILDLLITRLRITNKNIRGHFKYGMVYSNLYLTLLLVQKFGKDSEERIEDNIVTVKSLGMEFIANKINKIFGISSEEVKESLLLLHKVKLITVNLREKIVMIDNEKRVENYLKFIESESFNKLEHNLTDDERREKLEFVEIYKELIRSFKSVLIYS